MPTIIDDGVHRTVEFDCGSVDQPFLSVLDTLRVLHVLGELEQHLDAGAAITPNSHLHSNLTAFISGLQCHLLDCGINLE